MSNASSFPESVSCVGARVHDRLTGWRGRVESVFGHAVLVVDDEGARRVLPMTRLEASRDGQRCLKKGEG